VGADPDGRLTGFEAARLNKLLDLVAEIADPEEKAPFNWAVGDLMGLVFARLMVPVLRLKPVELARLLRDDED